MERRKELATFLKNRRTQTTPAEVGLPITARRRTPGLRHEEVAQLASIGLTWYTWLEQAREVRPSVQVLTRIGEALRLEPYETRHLLAEELGVDPPPIDRARVGGDGERGATTAVQRSLPWRVCASVHKPCGDRW